MNMQISQTIARTGCKFSLGNRTLILISMVESEIAHDYWINAGKGIINNEEATSGRENKKIGLFLMKQPGAMNNENCTNFQQIYQLVTRQEVPRAVSSMMKETITVDMNEFATQNNNEKFSLPYIWVPIC